MRVWPHGSRRIYAAHAPNTQARSPRPGTAPYTPHNRPPPSALASRAGSLAHTAHCARAGNRRRQWAARCPGHCCDTSTNKRAQAPPIYPGNEPLPVALIKATYGILDAGPDEEPLVKAALAQPYTAAIPQQEFDAVVAPIAKGVGAAVARRLAKGLASCAGTGRRCLAACRRLRLPAIRSRVAGSWQLIEDGQPRYSRALHGTVVSLFTAMVSASCHCRKLWKRAVAAGVDMIMSMSLMQLQRGLTCPQARSYRRSCPNQQLRHSCMAKTDIITDEYLAVESNNALRKTD